MGLNRIFSLSVLCLLLLTACSKDASDVTPPADGDTDQEAESASESDSDMTEDGDIEADADGEGEKEGEAEVENDYYYSIPNDPQGRLGPGYSDSGFIKEFPYFDTGAQGLPSKNVLQVQPLATASMLALTDAGPASFDAENSTWSAFDTGCTMRDQPKLAAMLDHLPLAYAVDYEGGFALYYLDDEAACREIAAPDATRVLLAASIAGEKHYAAGFADGSIMHWSESSTATPLMLDTAVPVLAGGVLSDGAFVFAQATQLYKNSDLTAPGTVTRLADPPLAEEQVITSLIVLPDDRLVLGTNQGLLIQESLGGPFVEWPHECSYPDITSIRFYPQQDDESKGMYLIGSSYGAWYQRDHDDPHKTKHYFGSRIWLLSQTINDLAYDGRNMYFATPEGITRVEEREITLAQIAAEYDRITQERHVRDGYTSTSNILAVPGDVNGFSNGDDDNDGQWTEMYLASQSLRYAVTASESAKENARTAMQAMLRLEAVTGISGFFARSTVSADECQARIDSGAGEWHFSETLPEYCWKGDTSTDEFIGHFYGLPLYYDLVADDVEKEQIRATVTRTLDAVIDDGFCWRDLDGECTEHALFQPEHINAQLGGQLGDAGFNSVVILAALRFGYYATGEQRFLDAFNYLAIDEGYAEWVRICQEINTRFALNHDTDEMLMMALLTLTRYEYDPYLMEIWREGLDLEWQSQRPERNPEFNFTRCWAAGDGECDLQTSIDTMQMLPYSLLMWGEDNLPRADIDRSPRNDRHGVPQNKTVLPYDERRCMRWAENPYALQQGGVGRQEQSGTFWLLPYWMGRYLGLISEEVR